MAKRVLSIRRGRLLGRTIVFNLSYLLLIFASVALIMTDMHGGKMSKRIRASATDFLAPIVQVISKPVEVVTTIVTGVSDLANLRQENMTLKEENEKLSAWRSVALRIATENRSLRDLLKYNPRQSKEFITARVVSNVGGPFVRTALLDSGMLQGVGLDDVAMTSKGLVGRVTDVGQNSARILLLTDMNSRIPVYIGDQQFTSVLAGDNTATPKLLYIQNTEDIKVGDKIITSGHGGVFPASLPIGVINSVEGKNVTVGLNVDFSKLAHVILLKARLDNMVTDLKSVVKDLNAENPDKAANPLE